MSLGQGGSRREKEVEFFTAKAQLTKAFYKGNSRILREAPDDTPASLIAPGLWLAGKNIERDRAALEALQISHVLQVVP